MPSTTEAASAPRTEVVRVFLVDDHPLVRRGFEHLIDDEPDLEVCGEAETVSEALPAIARLKPDVAVIDIALSDGSGIELVKDIKARYPQVKVLVCTMHSETLYGERALRAGAMGFITKREAGHRFVDAIREILRGKVFVSPNLVDRVLHRLGRGEDVGTESLVSELSDRELEVFQLIGEGMATRQIAAKLHLSPKTIERYRDNIKQKLHLENAIELVRYATQWTLEGGSN